MTEPGSGRMLRPMPERLSAMDGSFLRVETANAHMHVAWSATFRVAPGASPPTVSRLRRSIAARLNAAPRFRKRLARPLPGMGEPFWVDDTRFDVAEHVLELGMRGEGLDDHRFGLLCDRVLSVPLSRSRPLWEIHLAPRLTGGRCGLVAKIHHALVDGKSALEVALLLFDLEPNAFAELPPPWEPAPTPGTGRLAAGALVSSGEELLRTARGAARLAGDPRVAPARIAGTLRRAALAVGEDLLRPAPASALNARIGPRRTLVRHSASIADLKRAARAHGATVNDAALAVVAGGLRALALERGEAPAPLKTMVPVNIRAPEERRSLGNRISFAFIDLPLDADSPAERLARVHAATVAFKRGERAAGADAVLSALGHLPDPLRGLAARMAAGPRVYNLTVSNIPGPRFPVYMLGAELLESHPVVPLAEGHALSIGLFSYREWLHFGLYAEPHAFPQVRELPGALGASLADLLRAVSPRGTKQARVRRRPRSIASSPALAIVAAR
jgi:diacylglycerol O-acyltransferase / wax synthase